MNAPETDTTSSPGRWWASFTADLPPRPAGLSALPTEITDVVVVGSGVAGCTAALAAADAGASVVVLEAGAGGGGTTFKSGGGTWIPNNSLMRARGREDDREATLRYMASISFPDSFDPEAPRYGIDERDFAQLESYFDHAAEAMDFLLDGRAAFREFQSYSGDYEGMVSYHSRQVEEWGRHLAPADPATGDQQLGDSLALQLAAALERAEVPLVVGHRVVDVLTDGDGGVVGVRAESPAGEVELRARRGVVFASGGFSQNPELVRRWFRGPIYGTGAVPTNRGDFVAIAEGLGAELGNMENGWLAQLPIEMTRDGSVEFGHGSLVMMASGDSMLMVNRHGRRVVNEKEIYQERTEAHFERDAEGNLENEILFLIFDDAVLGETRPWVIPWPAGTADEPYVIHGDTLVDLTAAIERRLAEIAELTGGIELAPEFGDGLAATVERFNEAARQGRDEDFGRGEALHEIDWNLPARDEHQKNPLLHPLAAAGPYHCVILGAATLDTSGGPRIDTEGRVLKPGGEPIPGLFGAGNCIASPAAAGYWSGGSTIGPAIAIGYRAGRAAAGAAKDQPAPAVDGRG
jgi:succinate dehydrogenase/fumarate reductase flavoprotein subunit